MRQKINANASEEAFLIKTFKFFDLNNNGVLSKNEFLKALAKLGIVLYDMEVFFQKIKSNNKIFIQIT